MKKILTTLFFITSFLCFSQNPNDCEFAIVLCGNSNIGLEPVGIGFDEFSLPGNNRPSCYFFDQNTIWFKVEFVGAGTFTFDIIPDDGIADYDFAIFGPDVTCTTLGEAIRCSSTNPEQAGVPANTGLNMTETDVTEGPNEDGNGYLMYINVLAGEEYYILLDRPHGSGDFDFEYTGTALLPSTPIANSVNNLIDCDSDENTDGFTEFDLDALIPDIVQAQNNLTVTFHKSLNNANIGVAPINSPYTNISNPQTIYYRVENIAGCTDFNSLTIEVENPFEATLPQGLLLCTENTVPITLETEPGFFYYEWSTGEEGANLNMIDVISPGPYFVIISDANGCKIKVSTIIEESSKANITDIVIVEYNGTENNATIIVEGFGDYEFSLDNTFFYQDSNFFTGLLNGFHTIYVRDLKGCGTVSKEFLILDYPKFFTPNQDGYHDTWEIIGISKIPLTQIYIYDRYGKLIKQLDLNSGGWDGTYNGNPLPSSDYWFTIIMKDAPNINGHFALKR